jgi:DNA repair protein RecO (recombination protein O)
MVENRDRLYRVEAVVLKRIDMGEADRLVTLLTREHGKVRAIAKGVRKTASRKAGHLELFMRSRLLLARGRDLDIITQAELIEPYLAMRDDLWRVTYACYAAEMLDQFIPEQEEHVELYDLLNAVLGWICEDDDLDRLMRWYELRVLDQVGFRPQLRDCIRCHEPLLPEQNRFSVVEGGVICPRCVGNQSGDDSGGLLSLALTPFKVLRFFQTRGYAACRGIQISRRTHRDLERLMHRYIAYHLERQLKSTEFLRLLRTQGMKE